MRPDPVLIAKIAAHPESPESRLACADWFEKHGNAPRAELVRAQVALSTRLNPEQRATLQRRANELLYEYTDEWAAEVPGLDGVKLRYSRGFVEELALSELRLAEHGGEILSSEPVYRLQIDVQDGEGLAKAAGQPWFEQVRWLKLLGKVDTGAQALAAARHVGHLEGLLATGIKAEGVSAVAGSETLTCLRSLSLTGSDELYQEGLEPLAQGKRSLERLFLTGIGLEYGLPGCMVEGESFRSLQWLALNRDELSDEDAEKLAKSKVLANLERLELAGNNITEEGALLFKSQKVLPRLKHLDLSGMWYDTRELEPLRRRFRSGLKL
jgi:uncharacterized protein (TIGR02996 family)